MSKNTFFTGQPIFSQIINLIPADKVNRLAKQYKTDRYYKKFHTYDHLLTMLYCIFSNCTSIREVVTGLTACQNKLQHLGLNYSVPKSTLSEANCNRDAEVFEHIYTLLYDIYRGFLPDSRNKNWRSKLYIFDSSTIALFQEILKNAGRCPMNGQKKGGIKVHTLIKADEDVPQLVKFTAASAHDTPFLRKVRLPKGSIATFDKGYVDYNQFAEWSRQSVTFVTRLRKSAVYEVVKERSLNSKDQIKGILCDKTVILGHTTHKKVTRFKARLIEFYDQKTKKFFQFITNNSKLAASTITEIYKQRWQIESLFKRIKQNFPLRYFLGDNENAIKIQIWCVLIADLLLKYIQSTCSRKWAFSNLVSMVRLHLMNYLHLIKFLNNPDRLKYSMKNTSNQLRLNLNST